MCVWADRSMTSMEQRINTPHSTHTGFCKIRYEKQQHAPEGMPPRLAGILNLKKEGDRQYNHAGKGGDLAKAGRGRQERQAVF